MNERAKEILSDAARWGKEALIEWAESVKDSPEAHCYTAIVVGLAAWCFL